MSKSSSQRRERIKQLERERDHFYRTKPDAFSPSIDQESEDICYATGHGGIKTKLSIPGTGKHSFAEEEISSYRDRRDYTSSDADFKRTTESLAKNPKSRVGAFDKLVSKETKARAKVFWVDKFHASDKSLLEDERARNAALEDSYEQLLIQVQQLQNTHLQDLRNSESRFHNASSALQKALVAKAEELVIISNKLASSEGRYERDSREWAKERVSLVSQVDQLATKDAETSQKLQDREKRLQEMNQLRKELAQRIASREQDLIKYGRALRDKEGDYVTEKETRMKLEIRALKLEQENERRETELRDLQVAYQRKQNEAEELGSAKLHLNEAKLTIEDLTRREKQYLGEIDQMSSRERKLFNQVEELTISERKLSQEMTRLTEKQTQVVSQNEELKRREERFLQDLDMATKKMDQQSEEIQKYDKLTRQYQLDSTKLLSDFSSLQSSAQELKLSNQSLSQQITMFKAQEETLVRENDALQAKIAVITRDLQVKQRELDLSQQEVQNLCTRLDAEISQQTEIRLQNKERFGSVSTKITELQDTLAETQQQLVELRNNEKQVRNILRQREETLKLQTASLAEAEGRVQELLSAHSKDSIEFEQFKNKKRDEILAIQDKYAHAKQAMDSEVNQIRFQLSQKQNLLGAAHEEIASLKEEIANLNTLKITLETRNNELSDNENSHQRQIANLTSTLAQKQQELVRTTSKHSSLIDQTKRIDEELKLYRDNHINTRDTDINRLQTNMDEISKRLKSQVEILLEKDTDSTHSRSPSGSPTKGRFSLAPAGVASPKPRLIPEPTAEGEEFEQLEKLFNRSPFLKS